MVLRVADKIPSMLAYWDADQRCRYANRAYERWFGVTPESLIGKHISELLGPIYPLNLPYIEGALRGEPQEFYREIPDPAGGPKRHSLANYIPDVIDGKVRGFFVLVSDVSPLRRAEAALKESEARFSGIVSMSADAIISIDKDHRIIIFNHGAKKIFGYTKDEILGSDLGVLLPARLREVHRQHIEDFLSCDTAARPMGERDLQIVGWRKNGEEFPAEATISKLEVNGNSLLTVVLRDVTERKRTELEQEILAETGSVLASSRDYRQTLDTIARLVVSHLADWCVIDMIEDAPNVERLTIVHRDPGKTPLCQALSALPVTREHTLGWSSIETKQPRVFDNITPEFIRSAAQNEEHGRLVLELAPRSALTVPLLTNEGVLGSISFLSSRPHRYDQRDVVFAVELARRASLAVENARLYEAKQRALLARDTMLGAVAHDLRSPLNSILLAAKLLDRQMSKQGDQQAQQNVEIISRAVNRANRLIRDLLDVTRIESGALTITQQPLAVCRLLDEMCSAQRLLAMEASVGLRVEGCDKPVEVWADQHRLLQVLENLVGNALKFTPKGGQITIRVVRGQGEVVFSVVDTGPGIQPEHLPHIFDRFWQGKDAERRGAGLGLAICKGIVEAHGGRIWAESTPGRGSTFSFTIPMTPGPHA